MTIGDILAVIAAVVALGATWAATLLLIALAFPNKTAQAQERLINGPGACFARGLGVLLGIGLLAIALMESHAGPLRLVSYALLAGLALMAALGSASIARLVGERIQGVGSPMSPFATLTRGTILYVAAGFLPVVGWLLVTPIAAVLSLGAGVGLLARPRVKRSPLEFGQEILSR